MSLSRDKRLRAMEEALTEMIELLGDRAYDSEIFRLNEPPFNRFPNTTWSEMERDGLIERLRALGPPLAKLTGDGWYRAMEMTSRIEDPEFKERLSGLTAAIKDRVKGRATDAFVHTNDLAKAARVSKDFVFNTIENHVIDRVFGIQGAQWSHRGKTIRIPQTFGLPPLDD